MSQRILTMHDKRPTIAANSQRSNRRPRRQRGAFVLVAVLMSLGVVSVLVLGWMRSGIARRDQARQAEQRLQADWLAESGLERAAASLSAKSEYPGEIWNIAAAELSGPDGARVEIKVAAVADRAAARRITVVADYPADPTRQSRVTKELILEP